MGNKYYLYSSAELARYYGLTRKGLAFYEEKGILSPDRTENHKYRIFSLSDCYNMYLTKLYANCSFSLSETAEILQHSDISNVISNMKIKLNEVQKEIWLKERILYHGERIIRTLKQAEAGGFFEIRESPEFYRLYVRTYWEAHISNDEESEEFEEWNRTVPVNTASLKYLMEEIRSGREEIDVNIGNIMMAEDFQRFGYPITGRVEHLPPTTCLHTILTGSGEEIYKRRWLQPALDYIERNGLQLTGNPFTSMLLVTGGGTGKIRWDEAWFPIARKD